ALVADDLARLARGLLELGLVGGGIVAGVRPVIPAYHERVAPLDRRPGVACDDGDTAYGLELRRGRRSLDDDDLLDPRYLHRRRAVIGSDFPAHHRRTSDDGIFQTGELGVDAVDGAAGCDVEEIDDLDVALAEISEGGLVLQLDLIGRRCRQ